MSPLRLLALAAALSTATVPPAAAQVRPPAAASVFLAGFVQDATTLAALPWQQERLGLSAEQTGALRALAGARGPAIRDLYDEIQMLFENAGTLGEPVDAHEAFALFYDIAEHKAEALMTMHAAAEAMLDVLTPEQRARWEAELAAAEQEQTGS